jgi:hypothetical protein
MKQFLITLLAVGVLASAAQAEARLMSTREQCVAACGQAVSDSCGWITKRGKFNRCRTKLINQCKRFGTNVMCPAPPPPAPAAPAPPAAPTTPTTVAPPVVTTTSTTRPYIPPTTTTTLPPPPGVLLQVALPTETILCDGYYATKIWVNLCGTNGAWGLNMNPYYFTFTQGSLSYGPSLCSFGYADSCGYQYSVNAPGCFSCALVYDAPYTGAPRDLFYSSYGSDGLLYQVDVAF